MILESLQLSASDLRARTGWDLKPEGLCKDERCVPIPADERGDDGTLDASALTKRLGMPLLHDEAHELWALGPESGGKVLTSAALPEITLPDLEGTPFSLSSLRGQKVLLVAWASW